MESEFNHTFTKSDNRKNISVHKESSDHHVYQIGLVTPETKLDGIYFLIFQFSNI